MSSALARQLAAHGIREARVLAAMEAIDRSLFVPEGLRREADVDRPLPIGFGQTISQPYIVAFMTEALVLAGDERVLEVGTGSGYQTAVLSRLAREVWSVEIVPELARRAESLLVGTLRLSNVSLRRGDGRAGWPEGAPFDRIVVTAAPEALPPALPLQLTAGGRLVVPLGAPGDQALFLVTRNAAGVVSQRRLIGVRFVPLVGAPVAGA